MPRNAPSDPARGGSRKAARTACRLALLILAALLLSSCGLPFFKLGETSF